MDSQPDQATKATKKTRAATKRTVWRDEDVDMIVAWLSERDQNGAFANAIASKKYPKDAARRFMDETQLEAKKPNISVNKVVDKWRGMSRQYSNMREKAETTGWGIDVAEHHKPIGEDAVQSIRAYMNEHCRWYYDYEILFSHNPNVTAPFLSESGQPDRVNTRPPGHEDEDNATTDDEKAPEDKQEEDKDDTQIPWDASPGRAFRREDTLDDILGLEPLEDDDDDVEELDKPPNDATTPCQNATIIATATTQKASIPAATVSAVTATPVTVAKTIVAVPKTKRKKPPKPVVEVHSDSDEERSIKKAKGRHQQRSVADAMVEVEGMKDKARRREEEAHRGRFEAEQKQRDQQHELLLQQGKERMMRQEESLLRLRLQLQLHGKGTSDADESELY